MIGNHIDLNIASYPIKSYKYTSYLAVTLKFEKKKI